MNNTYIVKPGDTLYGISNQFGVSVTELASLNNIKGSFLQVGRELLIPSKAGSNPNNMFMYTVKKGDTLYGIAKKYNTTYQAIMNLNYLNTPNLYIGQVLRIPEMYTKEEEMIMPEFINYVVKSGDTLYSISVNNKVDINTLMKDNSLVNNVLRVGQVLKIRTSKNGTTEIEECFGPDYIINESRTYIVKKGDTLYGIARMFNTPIDKIKQKNNLKTNTLSVGQKLII